MSLPQESSVVFSVQQLLDEEAARQNAAAAARELQLERERETRRLELEAEAAHAEYLAQQARDEERRQHSVYEAHLLEARLFAEGEIALARQHQETEHDLALRRYGLMADATRRQGYQRIIIAGMTTLLTSATGLWLFIIVLSQRRAEREHSQLIEQRVSERNEAVRRESVLRQQIQNLEIELQKKSHATARVPPRPEPLAVARPPVHFAKPLPKPPRPTCGCLASDPLCDCTP